jgi:hypothetical protein
MIAIAGCAPEVEEVVVEEPVPEVVQPFAGVESFSELDDAGRQALADLRMLIMLSGEIEVRIIGPANGDEPTACNRRLDRILWPGYIFLPGRVTWRVVQAEPGLWMEGDSLFIERKPFDPDPCFTEEPFLILAPDLDVSSGPPNLCVPTEELPSTWVHYWDYSVELRNSGCDTDDNRVDRFDPLVIIKPGKT